MLLFSCVPIQTVRWSVGGTMWVSHVLVRLMFDVFKILLIVHIVLVTLVAET